MHYINVAGVRRPLSQLALGTVAFSQIGEAVAFELMDAFVAAGGNTFDTAHGYGAGACEQILGRWVAERGNRERIVIIDKGCHPRGDSGPRVTPGAIHADLAESLERLQTDYVDLYLLHRDDESVPVGPLVEALNEERARGRIHAFGGSNWRHTRLAEANAYAAEHKLVGFAASSPNLSLARPQEPMWAGCISVDDEAHAWHIQTQMPLISWSSQAGGFFTGRYSPEERSNADMVRVYYTDANFARLERAREVARKKGRTANEVALAYVTSQPFPVVALIGPRTVEELKDSLSVDDFVLTPEELAYLECPA